MIKKIKFTFFKEKEINSIFYTDIFKPFCFEHSERDVKNVFDMASKFGTITPLPKFKLTFQPPISIQVSIENESKENEVDYAIQCKRTKNREWMPYKQQKVIQCSYFDTFALI